MKFNHIAAVLLVCIVYNYTNLFLSVIVCCRVTTVL